MCFTTHSRLFLLSLHIKMPWMIPCIFHALVNSHRTRVRDTFVELSTQGENKRREAYVSFLKKCFTFFSLHSLPDWLHHKMIMIMMMICTLCAHTTYLLYFYFSFELHQKICSMWGEGKRGLNYCEFYLFILNSTSFPFHFSSWEVFFVPRSGVIVIMHGFT